MKSVLAEVEVNSVFSPIEIHQMVDGQFNAVFATLGTWGLLTVEGRLGPVRETKYSIYYGVELQDFTASGSPLLLDIPKNLKPEAFIGQSVRVSGFLQSKRGLKYALQVTKIQLTQFTPTALLDDERTLRDIFSQPRKGPEEFPKGWDVLRIICIHSKSQVVVSDFENQLPPTDRRIEVEYVPVNMQEPDSIAETIQKAAGHVVILMRGGGREGEFEVFNRPRVLLSWRDLNAYKVSALGHANNTTILDWFSHKVCDTPTEAGQFIRQRAQESSRPNPYRTKEKERNDQIIEGLKTQHALKIEKYALEVEYLKDQQTMQASSSRRKHHFHILLAFMLGYFLHLLLK